MTQGPQPVEVDLTLIYHAAYYPGGEGFSKAFGSQGGATTLEFGRNLRGAAQARVARPHGTDRRGCSVHFMFMTSVTHPSVARGFPCAFLTISSSEYSAVPGPRVILQFTK
jgi:hypothetical protein